jgi:hypothetical protein
VNVAALERLHVTPDAGRRAEGCRASWSPSTDGRADALEVRHLIRVEHGPAVGADLAHAHVSFFTNGFARQRAIRPIST